MTEFRIPFKCGKDGSEWEAILGQVGPRLGFIAFSRADIRVELPNPGKKTEVMRRLNELLAAKPPLPPPSHVEIVEEDVQKELTADQITSYGFQCPTCHDSQPLLCPSCQKYSCQGGGRDSVGRVQCQWCGESLVFRTLTPEEASKQQSKAKVETTTRDLRLRYRELRSGSEEPELPPAAP